jgi:hypothetical protein
MDTFFSNIKLVGDFFVVPFLGLVAGLCAISPSLGDWIKRKDEAMKSSPWAWRFFGLFIMAFFVLYCIAGIKERNSESREQSPVHQYRMVLQDHVKNFAKNLSVFASKYNADDPMTPDEMETTWFPQINKWTTELNDEGITSTNLSNIFDEFRKRAGNDRGNGKLLKEISDELSRMADELSKDDNTIENTGEK